MAKHYRSGDGPFLKKKMTPKFSIYLENLHYFQIGIKYKMPNKNMDAFYFFVTKSPWESIYIFTSFQENYIKYLYFDCYNQKTRMVVKEFGRNLAYTVRNLKDFGRNLSKFQTFRSKS